MKRAFFLLVPVLGTFACSEYDLKTRTETSAGGSPTSNDSATPSVDTGEPEDIPEDTGGIPETPPEDTGMPDCSDFDASGVLPFDGDETCLREPTIGSFTPVIEWQWSDNPFHPAYRQIMAAPSIANLTDDNGDGLINADDTPDVVFTSFSGSAYSSAGSITALSGDSGETIWSVTSPGGHSIFGAGGVALGDLNGDGRVEACVPGTSVSVVCLNGTDGSFFWAGGTETSTYGCPSIADLTGDGQAEVIFGRTVLNSDGSLLFRGAGGRGGDHFMSVAIDWDLDGTLEVVAGNTVYRSDGTILWSDSLADAAPAVGDFNLDGLPDLVRAGSGVVLVTMNDGTLLWTLPTTGGGSAGAPTVADFDGDGYPEVGVADLSRYTVYDTDGTLLWSNATSDHSSSKTGSSVFDFEGDGAAEVVYADEHTLWIYDGATGDVKMAQEGHASGTLMEYPLIADVDNDGSTEIIVASNDYRFDGWGGITVIGDESGTWAPARPIWNQYAYHITNVNNDGSIPTTPEHNWLSWNNFRAGGTELGPANWLPDLLPVEPDLCLDECWNDSVAMSIPVKNAGLLSAHDVQIVLERSDGTIVRERTFAAVPSGTGRILGPIELTRSEWGEERLFAIVDWSDEHEECVEDNNRINLGRWPCESL